MSRSSIVTPENDVARGQLPEMSSEVNMLLVIEMLPAKKHHLPPQQGGANVLHLFRGKRAGQIDAMNFRANVHREGSYVGRGRGCRHLVLQSIYRHL